MTNELQSPLVSSRVLRTATRAAVTTALLVSAAVVAVAVSPGGDRTVEAIGEAFGSGGEYHAVTPARILDTRMPALDVAPAGRKPTGPESARLTFDVPVVGRGGLPAFASNGDGFDRNVLAVAVNITVVNPSGPGYLKAYGAGENPGDSSIVNFRPSEVVPNSAVLRPGRDGKLTVQVVTPPGAGSVDVLIDVFGWFSSSSYGTNGARLVAPPTGPGRIFDSRNATGGSAPLRAGEQRTIKIWGADASDPAVTDIVPNSADVVGVMLNITGVNNLGGSAATFFSLNPAPSSPSAPPTTSNVNLLRGQFRSNLAIVPVSADGNIYLYNLAGEAHAILDVAGYLVRNQPPTSCKGRVIPLVAPFRAFDTRQAAFFQQPLPPANAEDWSFRDFVNDVKIGGEPVGPQLGLIGNLTAAGLGRQYSWAPASSFLTAYPTPSGPGTQVPTVSNLVIAEGEVVPNMAFLTYGSSGSDPYQIRFYNRAGYLDYLLDVTAVVLADCAT
jgi:hypothetical protein